MSNSVFQDLGEWAAAVQDEDVPAAALRSGKHAILDCLGVAIAGSEHELAPVVRAYVEKTTTDQQCGLIGRHGRSSAEAAALFNGTVGHVLDFDDCSDTLGGHPTVPMLPSLLALAEVRGSSGQDLLTSYCVGYEVLAHIAQLVNFEHYDKGWHPTATLGVLGSAAACARLLRLDAAGVTAALSIASSFASGFKANFGTDMKSIQVGHAAQKGLIAALMAEAGVTGTPNAFEGPRGFAELYNGAGKFRTDAIRRSTAESWDLVAPGLVIKQYPCCGSTHPVVDAACAIHSQVDDPDGIDSVVVRLHPRRLAHTDRPAPTSPLEGKFSVQYAAATALAKGNVTLRDFDETHLHDPQIKGLLSRLVAEPLPEDRYGAEHFAGEVEVVLRDGRRLAERVEKAKGRGSLLALTDDEVMRKFRGCAEGVLRDGATEAVISSFFNLERVSDVRTLTGMMTDL